MKKIYNYNLSQNRQGIQDAVVRKFLSRVIAGTAVATESEQHPAMIQQCLKLLNIGTESMQESFTSMKLHEKTRALYPILSSAMETLEFAVDKFCVDHSGYYRLAMESEENPFADDSETDEKDDNDTEDVKEEAFGDDNIDGQGDEVVADAVMTNEGGEVLSETVTALINEMQERHAGELKSLAKLVLKLEKDHQDAKFSSEKEEADEFDDMKPEVEEDKKEDSTEEEKKEDKEDSDEESGENPFAEDDSQTDNENPFGDSEKDEKSEESDPFDDDEKEESNEEGKDNAKEGEANPFESFSPEHFSMEESIGFESGMLTNFVNVAADKMLMPNIKSLFDQYGSESVEVKTALEHYQRKSKSLMENMVYTVSAMESFGIHYNKDVIRFPDLYLEV